MKSKSELKRRSIQKNEQDWHYCHDCQLKRGGKVPKNQGAITVCGGICSMCSEEKTLVPNEDYIWKGGFYAWD